MYICNMCGSRYLYNADCMSCESQLMELPIIPLGYKLIEECYGTKENVIVASIYMVKHQIHYELEYENSEYGRFTVFGNECLKDWFGDQVLLK